MRLFTGLKENKLPRSIGLGLFWLRNQLWRAGGVQQYGGGSTPAGRSDSGAASASLVRPVLQHGVRPAAQPSPAQPCPAEHSGTLVEFTAGHLVASKQRIKSKKKWEWILKTETTRLTKIPRLLEVATGTDNANAGVDEDVTDATAAGRTGRTCHQAVSLRWVHAVEI